MRYIILVFALLVGFLFIPTKPTLACLDPVCDVVPCETESGVQGWCQQNCTCSSGSCPGGCGSGFYCCTDGKAHGGSGNCCAVGSGGGGGTQPKGCWNGTVNCPAGTKVNFNKLVSTGCTREPHNSYKMCNAPGNAQKAGNPNSTGAWCCYGTWAKGDNCWINPSGKEICDEYWSCGNAALKTYACDPICTAVAPSVVTLNSPANGSVATTVSVTLNWNAIDNWGTACAGNNNRYRVYIGANGATPTLVETTTSTSYLFTGTTGNTYYWYIQAHNGQLTANSETRNFLINAIPDPWWQVKDADISAAGDIISAVPAGFIFGENGLGGYPGIPVYSGTTADFSKEAGDSGVASSTGWLANTGSDVNKLYTFELFRNSVPASVVMNEISGNSLDGSFFETGGVLSHGYYWYRYSGANNGGLDLNITSSADLGDRKVILLVDGASLQIDGQINLDDGRGFFMALVGKNTEGGKGDIRIDGSVGGSGVAHIEGLYFAENIFFTGGSDQRLYIRGSVAARGGVSMERDLDYGNDVVPAEYFEYAPDQVLLFPCLKSASRLLVIRQFAPFALKNEFLFEHTFTTINFQKNFLVIQ